eukprot:jgi/Tetstr1/449794/TSEL_036858.t1
MNDSPTKTVIKTKPRVERNRVLVTGGTKENISHLMGRENFEFIRHDVTDAIKLEIDQIYHLACPASPVHYKYNPIKTTKTSFIWNAQHAGPGKAHGRPVPPDVDIGGVRRPSSASADRGVLGEMSILSASGHATTKASVWQRRWHLTTGAQTVSRSESSAFSTRYGPRMALDDGRVVSNFVAQALLGQSLTVYGDGQQTRSFQYVSDLINGMVKMMDR